MADITATFDIDNDVDPTLTDPEDIVGDILDTYNEWARANGQPEAGISNMTAEWDQ